MADIVTKERFAELLKTAGPIYDPEPVIQAFNELQDAACALERQAHPLRSMRSVHASAQNAPEINPLAQMVVVPTPNEMLRLGYELGSAKEPEPDPAELQVGDRLYSTCAAEDYGVIVGVGADDNDIPTIDIEVKNPNDLIIQPAGMPDDADFDPDFPDFHGLTTLDIGGAKAILRKVQYRAESTDRSPYLDDDAGIRVICKTPGDGCWRCTKSFIVLRSVTVR